MLIRRCFGVDYPSDSKHRSLPSETNVVIGFSPNLKRQVGRFPPPVAQSGRRASLLVLATTGAILRVLKRETSSLPPCAIPAVHGLQRSRDQPVA